MTIATGQPIKADDFINENERNATPEHDEGKVPKIEDDGHLGSFFIERLTFYKDTYEEIDATTPKPVYVNKTGNIQTGKADVTERAKFIGFAISSTTDLYPDFLNSGDGGTSFSFSPNAGIDRILFVDVTIFSSGAIVLPSGVTFDGQEMTLLDSYKTEAGSNNQGHAVYYLPIGSSGSATPGTVVVTGATGITIKTICAVYDKVNQVDPIGISGKATSSSVSLESEQAPTRIINFSLNANSTTVPAGSSGQTTRISSTHPEGGFAIMDVLSTLFASQNYGSSNTHHIIACELLPANIGTVKIIYSGKVNGLTSLSIHSKYYLANTAGAISTTPGTTSVLVGKALSETELLIIQS